MRSRNAKRAAIATLLVVGGTVIGGTVVTGCSGGGASSHSSASGGSVSVPRAAAAGPGSGSVGKGPSGGRAQSTAARRLGNPGAKLVYTAQLTVRAKDVPAALAQATDIVTSTGGYVSSENAGTGARASATVTLKIPVTGYAATLAQLAGPAVGTEVSLRQQAQDVTQQVADVDSQVASGQAAIAQLRALLRHAGSIGDLLDVQNQINTEESDLESLQAQQKALDGETSYGTVTLTIVPVPVKTLGSVAPPRRPPGLITGLTHGWHAFTVTVSWLLAIAGAIAPFAAALAAIAVAAWLLRRRIAVRLGARRRADGYFSEESPEG